MIEVTDKNFEDVVLSSDIPVFVDFWANWCGVCRGMMPAVEELADVYEGKLKFVKVNVDDAENVASKYSIRGLPTMMIFNKGEQVGSVSGNYSKTGLDNFISSNA